MNKEILYEILNSRSEKMSLNDIQAILDEELDKSPSEMDTDLVDLCLDALESADEKKLNKKNHKVKLTKVLIAAVIFVVMVGICIPVCANFLSIDVPNEIVRIYKEFFKIDISDTEYVDDIGGQLELDGFENVALPEIVFLGDTQLSNYSKEETNGHTMINFDFEKDEINGHISMQKYHNNYSFSLYNEKETSEFEKINYYMINNIEVVVLGNNDYSHIRYVVDNTEYNIFLYNNYETACQIAETL